MSNDDIVIHEIDMINIYACPICKTKPVYSFDTNFMTVAKCGNLSCGHLFSINSIINAGIHEHDRYDAVLYETRNKRLVNRLRAVGFLGENLKILDIGSGLGHIVQEIKAQIPSIEIICIEAAPQAILELKKKEFRVLESFSDIDANDLESFDRILLIEVIEHMDKPCEIFNECYRLLRTGGRILITTPSGELRAGNHKTAAYKVKEHVQFFTEASLRLSIESSGFHKIRFLNLREYYCGSKNEIFKLIKDLTRLIRDIAFGRHHFIVYVEK